MQGNGSAYSVAQSKASCDCSSRVQFPELGSTVGISPMPKPVRLKTGLFTIPLTIGGKTFNRSLRTKNAQRAAKLAAKITVAQKERKKMPFPEGVNTAGEYAEWLVGCTIKANPPKRLPRAVERKEREESEATLALLNYLLEQFSIYHPNITGTLRINITKLRRFTNQHWHKRKRFQHITAEQAKAISLGDGQVLLYVLERYNIDKIKLHDGDGLSIQPTPQHDEQTP